MTNAHGVASNGRVPARLPSRRRPPLPSEVSATYPRLRSSGTSSVVHIETMKCEQANNPSIIRLLDSSMQRGRGFTLRLRPVRSSKVLLPPT